MLSLVNFKAERKFMEFIQTDLEAYDKIIYRVWDILWFSVVYSRLLLAWGWVNRSRDVGLGMYKGVKIRWNAVMLKKKDIDRANRWIEQGLWVLWLDCGTNCQERQEKEEIGAGLYQKGGKSKIRARIRRNAACYQRGKDM